MSAARAKRPNERGQLGALRHAFLARFFDNDITGGSDDLRGSFFWLIGFLAAPAFLLGVVLMLNWEQVARTQGAAAVRAGAPSVLVLYLSYGMVASGLLAAITWSSLLIDRRDALILGGLPVKPRVIVTGKLVALASYLGLLTLAMNGPAALSVGFALSAGSDFTFVLRGIATHLVTGGLSCALMFLIVTSLQGMAMLLTGPRTFARVSAVLQVALIACVLIAFVFQPYFAVVTRDTLRGFGRLNVPWMLNTPPFWFLGTYEWLLGSDNPTVTMLHWRAMGAFGLATLMTALTYLLSYPRLSRSAVEGRDAPVPRPRTAASVERLVQLLSDHPVSRAAAQFFATSLARVERLRFIGAMTMGVVIGWSAPMVFLWMGAAADRPDYDPAPLGPTALLTLSFAALSILLVGLRVAAAMPSDLKASWIIPTIGTDGVPMRTGLWRLLYVIAVLPVAVTFGGVIGWFFGPAFGLSHAVILLAVGALLVELVLWNHDRMPNATPWRPERVQLGKRWPLYFFSFLFASWSVAYIENLVLGRAVLVAGLAISILAIAVTLRIAHRRRVVLPRDDEIHEIVDAPAVLRIG